MFIECQTPKKRPTPAIYEFIYAQCSRNPHFGRHTHKKSDSPSLGATCTIDKNDIFRVN
jgi:hypothetical protein